MYIMEKFHTISNKNPINIKNHFIVIAITTISIFFTAINYINIPFFQHAHVIDRPPISDINLGFENIVNEKKAELVLAITELN